MTYSIRALIRRFIAPPYKLSCSSSLWAEGLKELNRRGKGQRESGAFLLGTSGGQMRCITHLVYYDEIEPDCLDSGIVVFTGEGYGTLWQICRKLNLDVVADIHSHYGMALQSDLDLRNPMVAQPGHIAIIVPSFARRIVHPTELGIYEYLGDHRWINHSGKKAKNFFYIGLGG